jgi:hypothetical protein
MRSVLNSLSGRKRSFQTAVAGARTSSRGNLTGWNSCSDEKALHCVIHCRGGRHSSGSTVDTPSGRTKLWIEAFFHVQSLFSDREL